jgi:transposase
MILNYNINTDISVNNLMDLNKLKSFEDESNLKVNASELARELGVDRRTIRKYINGYEKTETRKRKTQFDGYYEIIDELLGNDIKIFKYKSMLYRYLSDNHGLKAPESSFRRYISSIEKFNDYFTNKKHATVSDKSAMRFETDLGKQGQVDWKESMEIVLNTGEMVIINIFVFLLSYSRYRVYRVSITKTRDVLRHFLSEAFETIGGVPEEILFDNMKTVMDVSRTRYFKGKINDEFFEFANDFGFKVKPCIAARAQTKGKVESPMRILDELYAYNGDLSYEQLVMKVTEINNRENNRFHESYRAIPILGLNKEKNALLALPNSEIRRHHKIKSKTLSVNKSSMISFESRLYSVPPKYISKRVSVQCFDNQLHVYYNTELIALHSPSNKHLNYQSDHYKQISKLTLPFDEDDIEEIAKNNLKIIGARYE